MNQSKRQQIIDALYKGHSRRTIARSLRVSVRTVEDVADEEWRKPETHLPLIAAQNKRIAILAAELLAKRGARKKTG